jgi:hypothetical protein
MEMESEENKKKHQSLNFLFLFSLIRYSNILIINKEKLIY